MCCSDEGHAHAYVHPPCAPRRSLCHCQGAAQPLACFSAWTGEKGRNAGGSTCAGFALQLNVSFKSLSILETAQDAPRGGVLPSHPC